MGANNSPKLLKATALAKATQLESRVNALVATSTTDLSPSTVYLQGGDVQVSENGAIAAAGTWTCPDNVYSVQVECQGAGAGGGGGNSVNGGGGGGGGEYASEQNYAVLPGNTYTFAVGRAGQGGVCGGPGGYPGGNTIFDTSGPGVIANGGLGGDGSTQINGGTGSTNSIHYNGGNGGVSSAGVNSDNLAGIASPMCWFRMDENGGSNGEFSTFNDATGNGKYASILDNSKAGVKSSANSAPLQAPTKTTSNTTQGNASIWGQTSGSTPAYATIIGSGVGKGLASPANGSHLTVSCWVKGDPTAGVWGYWNGYGHNYVALINNCNFPAGVNGQGHTPPANTDGFALFIQNNFPAFYLGNASESGAWGGVASLTTISPTDGLWHYIVGTWDGTTMRLYVDGSLSNTGSPGFSDGKFAQAEQLAAIGVNAHNLNDSAFVGYMSNAWISFSTASSAYITTAYGATPAAGGSGGGAAGGSSTWTGANNGANAISTTGAVGATGTGGKDSYHVGGGFGGNGGNSSANGQAAPVSPWGTYGGGGGGAGKGSGLATVNQISVSALHSASYTGLDAQGGNAGVIYDASDAPQFGVVSPYPAASLLSEKMYVGGDPSSSFNGSLNSVAVMPYMVSSLAGYNVNKISIAFTVQSINASVLPVGYGTAKDIPHSLASDSDITTYLGAYTQLLQIPVPAGTAGRQVTFDITDTTFISKFKSTQVALVFGGLQGSATHDIGNGAYSTQDSYAWNTVLNGAASPDPANDLTLTFETWSTTGSNTTGGDGAPGNLVLTFVDERYWPVASSNPTATTDSNGNTFAAGYTTDSIVGFDPTVTTAPRQPEVWHTLGSLAGGSGLTVDTARYRYAPDDGGTLVIQFACHTSGTTINSGGYGFSVSLPGEVTPTVSTTGTADLINIPLTLGAGSNQLPFGVLRISGKNNSGAGGVSLQIANNLTVASGNPIHVTQKIALT
jgi:hypothetical protein